MTWRSPAICTTTMDTAGSFSFSLTTLVMLTPLDHKLCLCLILHPYSLHPANCKHSLNRCRYPNEWILTSLHIWDHTLLQMYHGVCVFTHIYSRSLRGHPQRTQPGRCVGLRTSCLGLVRHLVVTDCKVPSRCIFRQQGLGERTPLHCPDPGADSEVIPFSFMELQMDERFYPLMFIWNWGCRAESAHRSSLPFPSLHF